MLIDSCVTQFKAQGPSRTCSESKEEEEHLRVSGLMVHPLCGLQTDSCLDINQERARRARI